MTNFPQPTPTSPRGQSPTAGLKLDKTTIPNPSSVRWTWAEWSGKANPNTKQWTPPLMTWKRRSKKLLRRLGKSSAALPPPNPTNKLILAYIIFIVAFGGGARGRRGTKLDKTTIPNPSSVRWTWAEWSGKANPNTKQWTPPLMTWKRRSKKLLRRLGKTTPHRQNSQSTYPNIAAWTSVGLRLD